MGMNGSRLKTPQWRSCKFILVTVFANVKNFNSFFCKNGPILTYFGLFSSFSHHSSNIIWKSVDVVLGDRTLGYRMVGKTIPLSYGDIPVSFISYLSRNQSDPEVGNSWYNYSIWSPLFLKMGNASFSFINKHYYCLLLFIHVDLESCFRTIGFPCNHFRINLIALTYGQWLRFSW